MSTFEFVASLVQAVAWPATVVLALLLLRREIRTLLTHRLSTIEKEGKNWRLHFGEVAGAAIRAQESAEKAPVAQSDEPPLAGVELEAIAKRAMTAPLSAVDEAYAVLEDTLRRRLASVDDPSAVMHAGAHGLARAARKHGLINDAAVQTVEGLSHLRTLAHREGARLSAERALDYVRLTEVALYAVRHGQP